MNIAATYKTVKPVIQAISSYIDKDLHRFYGLLDPVELSYSGKGIGIGSCTVGPITIHSQPGGETVQLLILPFDARTEHWNGPNVIPDDWADGSMEASLVHDLIWKFAREIGEAVGMTEQDVMQWANGILVATWKGYGSAHGGKAVGLKTWTAYNLCSWSKRWWHKLFIIAVTSFTIWSLAGCSGCSSPPDWTLDATPPIVWTNAPCNQAE